MIFKQGGLSGVGDFVCGRCTRARASHQVVTDCGATLIVCPASILQQWQSEIAKHTQPGALRVITYLGQNKTCLDSLPATGAAPMDDALPIGATQRAGEEPVRKGRKGKHSGQDVVSAQDLASADVVLTTYDVLKRDVHHQADPDQQGKTFRTRKRYEVWCTPLQAIGSEQLHRPGARTLQRIPVILAAFTARVCLRNLTAECVGVGVVLTQEAQ